MADTSRPDTEIEADDVTSGGILEEGTRHARGVTVVHVLNVLLRHRRLLVAVPLTLALAVGLYTLLQRRTYTSAAAITPQDQEMQASSLTGLAAQFGVSLPIGGGGAQSPAFYVDLIKSRPLLSRLAETSYTVPRGGGTGDTLRGNLLDLYEIEADTQPLRLESALERLAEDVTATEKLESGLVQFTVRSPWPSLSRQMANRIVELINHFNVQTRHSQAAAERRFLGDRVDSARDDLRGAEDRLREFLDANRQYENSPRLVFEHDRLQRRVTLQQQVYTSLVQSYEKARIDEVRNTPVITVVEQPYTPARPDRRYLLAKVVLTLLLGGLIAGLAAFALEGWNRLRASDAESVREFRRLRRGLVQDLRTVWRRIRRAGD